MGNHILLFVFENELDANRVLLGEPWSFDKYLVVLRRYEDDSSLRGLRFDTAKFLGSGTWFTSSSYGYGDGKEPL